MARVARLVGNRVVAPESTGAHGKSGIVRMKGDGVSGKVEDAVRDGEARRMKGGRRSRHAHLGSISLGAGHVGDESGDCVLCDEGSCDGWFCWFCDCDCWFCCFCNCCWFDWFCCCDCWFCNCRGTSTPHSRRKPRHVIPVSGARLGFRGRLGDDYGIRFTKGAPIHPQRTRDGKDIG